MQSLMEKLNNINKPKIKLLQEGEAISIEEFWDKLIKNYLPEEKVIIGWHKLLLKYINSDNTLFAIRGYNTAPKDKYDELRRGFLTKTDKNFSFFYTDNFFAAYFQKMALDGYVPNYNEFYNVITTRKFPSRFGINTFNERQLLAIKQGKDPGLQNAGFKIAHIIPVGKEYFDGISKKGMAEILDTMFPKGVRTDWELKEDNIGSFYERELAVSDEAKKYIIAHFLRFVHPLNSFLCPKKTYEVNSCCKEIAEYQLLLDYAQYVFERKYKDIYGEYKQLIMYDDKLLSVEAGKEIINIKWGNENLKSHQNSFDKNKTKNEIENKSQKDSEKNKLEVVEDNIILKMAFEYLTNPETSFRKLEIQFLGIDSKARGGGFVAKKIINNLGITADKKGILKINTFSDEFFNAEGEYKLTLNKIKKLFLSNL